MSYAHTIAIVDDDEAIREALDDLLKSCGYRSRVFSSAEEYLAAGDRSDIACILLDVKMPGKSGLELQAELNKASDNPAIIFISSYRDSRTRSAALDGGAFAIFGKPVNVDELLGSLEKALISGVNDPR